MKSHARQEMPRAASHSSGNSGRGDFVKATTAEYQHAENGEKRNERSRSRGTSRHMTEQGNEFASSGSETGMKPI